MLSLFAIVLAGCSQISGSPPGPATWRIAGPVTPESTSLDLMINEVACASGKSPAGRIVDPIVEYGTAAITITVQVMPLGGGVQTCQGNPEFPLTVRLAEPVGDRELIGGAPQLLPVPTSTPAH